MPIYLIGLIVLIALYIFSTYNKFRTTETRLKASIQEIGNQLKRQAEMIPNLVASVKGYMKHEQSALTKITDARKTILQAVKSNDVQKLVDAAANLQSAITPIQAVFESTPELKAAGPSQKLMDELRDTADKVMYSRRTLIDLSADFNVMIVTFTSSLSAKLCSFKQEPGLKTAETGEHVEVAKADTKTPKVKL